MLSLRLRRAALARAVTLAPDSPAYGVLVSALNGHGSVRDALRVTA